MELNSFWVPGCQSHLKNSYLLLECLNLVFLLVGVNGLTKQLSEINYELVSWSYSLWCWWGQVRLGGSLDGEAGLCSLAWCWGERYPFFLEVDGYFLWLVLKTNNPPWTRLTRNIVLGNSRGTPASACPVVLIPSHRAERNRGFCFCCGMQLPLMWTRFAVNWFWRCVFWGTEEFLRISPFTRCPLGHRGS